ncbi:MAG: DUF72 domain-containing protein [Acidobacteriota bacterium]|nr:DUF72 domain-containing protein [Acidobacteriota bacterium]
MKKYYAGTAGWSYEDWEGIVYPAVKGRGFHPLSYLASLIDLVEINSTFYRPASVSMACSWLRHVQNYPDFLFTVKLLQIFTHQRENIPAQIADDFKRGIAPLAASQRLAAILIQFPWSFINSSENRAYLQKLLALFSDFPLALEVRHSSWDRPEFYEFLRDRKVAYGNIDQPIFQSSIKPSAIVTNPDFSYVRLHGRNYEDWFKQGAGRDERYNYLYSSEELEDWAGRIKKLAEGSNRVLVITNNHYRGQALANALQLKNKLTGEKFNIPAAMLEKYPVLRELAENLEKGQKTMFNEGPESWPEGGETSEDKIHPGHKN